MECLTPVLPTCGTECSSGRYGTDRAEAAATDRPETLERLAGWNRRRAKAIMPWGFDPDGDIGITYERHREAYDGTDRESAPLNPARVHQYEEWR